MSTSVKGGGKRVEGNANLPSTLHASPSAYALLLVRLLIGGVLLYAGFAKALAPAAEFAAAMANYHLFPSSGLLPMAWIIPWIEIWTGLFLIAGLYTQAAAAVASGLFVSFLAVMASALWRHIDLASCGCFGAETFSPHTTFKIDIGLLLLSLLLTYCYRRTWPFTVDHKVD